MQTYTVSINVTYNAGNAFHGRIGEAVDNVQAEGSSLRRLKACEQILEGCTRKTYLVALNDRTRERERLHSVSGKDSTISVPALAPTVQGMYD